LNLICSSDETKRSCYENHKRSIEARSNEGKLVTDSDKTNNENTCRKTLKELTDCYLDSSSKIVENKTWKVSPSKNLLAVCGSKKTDEKELDCDEEDASSVHSYSSMPSLASEPEDKCLPFKLVKVCNPESLIQA